MPPRRQYARESAVEAAARRDADAAALSRQIAALAVDLEELRLAVSNKLSSPPRRPIPALGRTLVDELDPYGDSKDESASIWDDDSIRDAEPIWDAEPDEPILDAEPIWVAKPIWDAELAESIWDAELVESIWNAEPIWDVEPTEPIWDDEPIHQATTHELHLEFVSLAPHLQVAAPHHQDVDKEEHCENLSTCGKERVRVYDKLVDVHDNNVEDAERKDGISFPGGYISQIEGTQDAPMESHSLVQHVQNLPDFEMMVAAPAPRQCVAAIALESCLQSRRRLVFDPGGSLLELSGSRSNLFRDGENDVNRKKSKILSCSLSY